jgi:hypothetical protein
MNKTLVVLSIVSVALLAVVAFAVEIGDPPKLKSNMTNSEAADVFKSMPKPIQLALISGELYRREDLKMAKDGLDKLRKAQQTPEIIEEIRKLNKRIDQLKRTDVFSPAPLAEAPLDGTIGAITRFKVIQVIDDRSGLIRLGGIDSPIYLLRDVNFVGVSDDTPAGKLGDCFIVSGTYSYTSPDGAQRTVSAISPFDMSPWYNVKILHAMQAMVKD